MVGRQRNAHSNKRKLKPQMLLPGGKVSMKEMKWKIPTNWKPGPEVEGKNWKALEQGDTSLKGWSREAQSSCTSKPHCQKERTVQGAAAASGSGGLS